VAAGLLRGEHPQIPFEALAADAFLLDVRTAKEFAAGHVPGAVNVPIDELRDRLGEIPKGRPTAAYCQVGQRGYLATRLLNQSGFDAVNVSGGYKTYRLLHPADASA
jgi:rhodanese-related sulfurtransferase